MVNMCSYLFNNVQTHMEIHYMRQKQNLDSSNKLKSQYLLSAPLFFSRVWTQVKSSSNFFKYS